MGKFGEVEEVYLMREKKEQGGASKCAAFVKVPTCTHTHIHVYIYT
jgi:hypothetical protein